MNLNNGDMLHAKSGQKHTHRWQNMLKDGCSTKNINKKQKKVGTPKLQK